MTRDKDLPEDVKRFIEALEQPSPRTLLVFDIYDEAFLNKVCDDMGLTNEETRYFFMKRLLHAGNRYLTLKKLNSDRIRPHLQEDILDNFKEAVKSLEIAYTNIRQHNTTSGKLQKAIRLNLDSLEPKNIQRDMFHPFCNLGDGKEKLGGFALDAFKDMLRLLAKSAEEAKEIDIGNDKADLSSQFLTEWVTVIAKAWPEEANFRFALGKRDEELKMYTSPSIQIVFRLIHHLEPDIEEKNVQTFMRYVIRDKLINHPVANFFIG